MKTYFIQAESGGPIKIGRSISPADRLVGLQTSNPEKLVLLAVIDGDVEGHFHARFRESRLRGEWFEPSQELLKEIRDLGGSPQGGKAPYKHTTILDNLIESERLRLGGGMVLEWDEMDVITLLSNHMEFADECIASEETNEESDDSECDCSRCEIQRGIEDLSDLPIRAVIWNEPHLVVLVERLGFCKPEFREKSYVAMTLDNAFWCLDSAYVQLDARFFNSNGEVQSIEEYLGGPNFGPKLKQAVG